MTYTLIRKEFEVACVDHVGADLIAENGKQKIAVPVKTRMFRGGSTESQMVVFESSHLDKLEHFASRFSLEPVLAQVLCMVDDGTIHLFLLRAAGIRERLKQVKHGYSFRFGKKHLQALIDLPYVDYSCWKNEQISAGLFSSGAQQPVTWTPDNVKGNDS